MRVEMIDSAMLIAMRVDMIDSTMHYSNACRYISDKLLQQCLIAMCVDNLIKSINIKSRLQRLSLHRRHSRVLSI